MSRRCVTLSLLALAALCSLGGTLAAVDRSQGPADPQKQIQELRQRLADEIKRNADLQLRAQQLQKEVDQLQAQLARSVTEMHVLPNGQAVPDNWVAKRFNGMPFYLVPLTNDQAARNPSTVVVTPPSR